MLNIEAIDFSQNNVLYAPSWEELNGIEALRRNDRTSAYDWFDRAILSDPARGARVYNLCWQMDSSLRGRYAPFANAAREYDLKRYVKEVGYVVERRPEWHYPNVLQRAEEITWQIPILKNDPVQLIPPKPLSSHFDAVATLAGSSKTETHKAKQE